MLTRNEVIAMARESRVCTWAIPPDERVAEWERFAALVESRTQAATLATVTPLLQLALEEIDDGEEHAQDCMTRYGGYPCRCQKPATLAKLRAFLSGATKESTDHG